MSSFRKITQETLADSGQGHHQLGSQVQVGHLPGTVGVLAFLQLNLV